MNELKICIDARMVNNSGIGVYIVNYVNYFLGNEVFDKVVLIGRKVELLDKFSKFSNWDFIEMNVSIYSLKEQIYFLFLVPKCDIFWSPHYNIPLLPINAKKRIVTIPDVAHLALNSDFSFFKKIYAKFVIKAATVLSDKITTISTFSKSEIVFYTKVFDGKVTSIPLGLNKEIFNVNFDKNLAAKVLVKYDLPEKYILYVGNVKPHKNLEALLDAFLLIQSKIASYKVVIIGRKNGFITSDQKLFNKIRNNSILEEKIIFTGFVAGSDLPKIYSMASIFVFPSLYEGFGFPPLEAMASGCPVICSQRASLPEVCGNGVLYVDPISPSEIANNILKVLENEEFKNDLIEKGLEKVKKYNWNDSSKMFTKLISE